MRTDAKSYHWQDRKGLVHLAESYKNNGTVSGLSWATLCLNHAPARHHPAHDKQPLTCFTCIQKAALEHGVDCIRNCATNHAGEHFGRCRQLHTCERCSLE